MAKIKPLKAFSLTLGESVERKRRKSYRGKILLIDIGSVAI